MKNKLIILSIISAGLIGVQGLSPSADYFDINRNLDIFATLFKELNAYYVDEIDPDIISEKAVPAMLESLDPYTEFISERDISEFRSSTTGRYAGIGVLISLIDNEVRISRVYQGFSAQKAGIRVGDRLVEINGHQVTKENVSQVSELLKGSASTRVEVVVEREGKNKPLSIELTRQNITLGAVTCSTLLDDSTAFIRLEEFTVGAGFHIRSELKKLKKQGAKRVILDLRDNPGGLLEEAVNVSSLFIPKGSLVVKTQGRIEEWNKSYNTLDQPVDTAIPLCVLINGNTASAAEIVAGVIQDYDRGVLVGESTFGKGLVQTTRPLKYNAQLKITSAKYYIPSGRCIQSVDYTHRDANGDGEVIADSMQILHYTQSGRVVYDGSGLRPDIPLDAGFYAPVTVRLLNKGHIFNYASYFHARNDSIPPAAEFSISKEEYKNFTEWVKTRNMSYVTKVEKGLDDLVASAGKEMYLQDIQKEVTALEKSINNQKKEDLITFREEISRLLTEEIASRYYFYQGGIEASLKSDPDLTAARRILGNRSEYSKILNR